MSSSTITVLTCDRCGKSEELRSETVRPAWGKIAIQAPTDTLSGRARTVGNSEIGADLCPDCIVAALSWWDQQAEASTPDASSRRRKSGKAPPLAPPAPAPPPSPSLPTRITPKDASACGVIIAKAISDQVEFAVEKLRERPSSLLMEVTDPDFPFVSEGTMERAAKAIHEIAQRIGAGLEADRMLMPVK